MYRVWNFITEYSILLVIGAGIALVWANTDPTSYHHFVEHPIWFNPWIGVDLHHWTAAYGPAAHHIQVGDVEKVLTLHYVVNDMAMALFFAIAAKEVWEAIVLKNGSLRGRKAATPLVATAGGMIGPITVYLGLALLLGSDTFDAVYRGWAIPTATDIAFSYLVGRIVFGAGHPAVRFLLLLAIADDAAGLIILAIFYPSGDLAPVWLLLSAGAALGAYLMFNWLPRRIDGENPTRPASTWARVHLRYWPYVVAGAISWFGFAQSGLHPALGLLPVVPAIPHADHAFGLFSEAERYLHDLLNVMEHALKVPVEIVLFFFGLANAGVEFSAIGAPTWLVLAGLLIGKPLGVLLFGWFASDVLRFGLPAGMRRRDLIVTGLVAAIGFTVALFVASVAFDRGPVQDAAKMGALMSFGAAFVAMAVARLLGVKRRHE